MLSAVLERLPHLFDCISELGGCASVALTSSHVFYERFH